MYIYNQIKKLKKKSQEKKKWRENFSGRRVERYVCGANHASVNVLFMAAIQFLRRNWQNSLFSFPLRTIYTSQKPFFSSIVHELQVKHIKKIENGEKIYAAFAVTILYFRTHTRVI